MENSLNPPCPVLAGRLALVVDDDPHLTRVTRRLLESVGMIVREEYDGQRALSALNEWLPDVILLDLDMPHANGFEVCRQSRNHPKRD